jgi:hypothetical protein
MLHRLVIPLIIDLFMCIVFFLVPLLLLGRLGQQIDLRSEGWIIRKDVLCVIRRGRQLTICL